MTIIPDTPAVRDTADHPAPVPEPLAAPVALADVAPAGDILTVAVEYGYAFLQTIAAPFPVVARWAAVGLTDDDVINEATYHADSAGFAVTSARPTASGWTLSGAPQLPSPDRACPVICKATRGRDSFRFRTTSPDSRYARILRAAGWTITQLDPEVTR